MFVLMLLPHEKTGSARPRFVRGQTVSMTRLRGQAITGQRAGMAPDANSAGQVRYTRNTAPSFLPSSRLLATSVAVRKAIAHTPRAAATYLPVPSSWNSSKIALVIGM